MERIPFQATAAGARYESVPGVPVAVLLDNVRSMYNVGAFFRTSDAAGAEKLYLCGITGRPPVVTFAGAGNLDQARCRLCRRKD